MSAGREAGGGEENGVNLWSETSGVGIVTESGLYVIVVESMECELFDFGCGGSCNMFCLD